MAYTYDDFQKAANQAGLLGNFSQYDLDLTKRYPEFGLSLLSLKQDYGKATTDEQRLLANEAANELRRSYGNYTAGADGNGYYSEGKLPGQIDTALEQLGSFGPFSYGRENEYQAALDAVRNQTPFSYDYSQDPVWQSYHKQYAREGQRAGQDTMGQYAAMTGGMPSTAAINAGQQANNYYAAQAADVIPQLYQQAYDRYTQDFQNRLSTLQAMMADRKQAQSEYLSDYDMLRAYLGDLQGQDAADRSMQQQAWENQMALAQLAAQSGDYSYLAGLGINTDALGDGAYAYGDGEPYAIRSYAGQYFIANAVPGQTMRGGDGSLWTKNADGSVTITTQDGRTYSMGGEGTGWYGDGGDGIDTDDTDDAEAQAIEAFNNGDRSDAVIEALLAAGFTQEQLQEAGYSGKYFSPIKSPSDLSPKALNLLNQMARSNSGDKLGYFYEHIKNGGFSEDERDYLLSALGY